MLTTIVRNGLIVFYTVHWAACLFYYIARQSYFNDMTW
jgi:hypothetical protein